MAQFETWLKTDLQRPPQVKCLGGAVFSQGQNTVACFNKPAGAIALCLKNSEGYSKVCKYNFAAYSFCLV